MQKQWEVQLEALDGRIAGIKGRISSVTLKVCAHRKSIVKICDRILDCFSLLGGLTVLICLAAETR